MIELLKNNYQNDYSIEIENEKTFFIWFVIDETCNDFYIN